MHPKGRYRCAERNVADSATMPPVKYSLSNTHQHGLEQQRGHYLLLRLSRKGPKQRLVPKQLWSATVVVRAQVSRGWTNERKHGEHLSRKYDGRRCLAKVPDRHETMLCKSVWTTKTICMTHQPRNFTNWSISSFVQNLHHELLRLGEDQSCIRKCIGHF